MIATRRELLAGATAVAGVGALDWGAHRAPSADADLSGLVPSGADLLLLAPVAGGEALRRRLGARTGHTLVRPVAPLARAGFGDVAALIARARSVHVLAAVDTAEALVIDTLLRRAGAAPTMTAGVLIARL